MTPPGNRPPRRPTAFTLIEVLLAIVISGMVLTAASSFLVSIANIWINRGDNDFFVQHVDGVGVFLNQALALSEGTEELGEGEDDLPVVWARPPGYSEFEPPLLAFRLRESPPLLSTLEFPLPGVTAYLYFREDRGLYLLWHPHLVETEDIDDVYRTPLSPYCKGLEYHYYDEEEELWETTDEPLEDDDRQFILPDYLTLHFTWEDETRSVPVYVPRRDQNVPLF